jgi:hypothetical protein
MPSIKNILIIHRYNPINNNIILILYSLIHLFIQNYRIKFKLTINQTIYKRIKDRIHNKSQINHKHLIINQRNQDKIENLKLYMTQVVLFKEILLNLHKSEFLQQILINIIKDFRVPIRSYKKRLQMKCL